MKNLYKYEASKGYHEVIGDTADLELIRFGLIRLHKGETVNLDSEGYEIGLVIFSGLCDVRVDLKAFASVGGRKDVFSGKPVTIYIPCYSNFSVTAVGDGIFEAGLCRVKSEKRYEPFIIMPEDVITAHRGQLNWQRDVNDIITSKYEGKVDRIVLGETYSYPGQWSSYPSHKHDTDNPPFEVNMEEVYHFKVGPDQGFGIQVMYNDDFSLEECYMVKNGDTVAIKKGYHPVASAPGYQVYYLWVMAGKGGRALTPCDDPKHAWIKAVETMVK